MNPHTSLPATAPLPSAPMHPTPSHDAKDSHSALNVTPNTAPQSLESREQLVEWSRAQFIEALERRESLLRAASFAAAQFLEAGWEKRIDAVLGSIGEAAQVSRLYIFENLPGSGGSVSSIRYEWTAPGIAPQIDNPQMQNTRWSDCGMGRWAQILAQGGVVQGMVDDFPASERVFLLEQGLKSVAVVPIWVDGQLWGVAGFDECGRERSWEDTDLEVLRLLGDMVGAALTRERSHAALAASEAELVALFNSMQDVILVLDRAGIYRKVVTSDPQLLKKPLEELEGNNLESVLGEPLSGQFRAIIGQVLDCRAVHRFEYPLQVQGGDVWFSASVSPLGDDTVLWVARDITAAYRSRETLRESEALFRLLAENSSDKIARCRPDGSFIYVSPSTETLLGHRPQDMVGRNALELLHPDDLEAVNRWHQRVLTTENQVEVVTYRMRHLKGHFLWFETTSRALRDENGEVTEIHTVSRDISARKSAEDALRRAEAKYRSIFENAVEGIFQTTPDGTYLDANPSLARIYGYESTQQLQTALTDIEHQLYFSAQRRAEFVTEMQERGLVANFESQVRRRDGQIIWISENARAVRDESGQVCYYEGTVEDISARKSAEEQLIHNALHDELTGLANRALFMDRLGQAFNRSQRHRDAFFAVLFLDFDRFKNVNDSLGHLVGDQLLISIAQRLQECLRPGDTVSRFGGDEFAILLEDSLDLDHVIQVAQRIQDALSEPFLLVGQQIFSSASIGIALYNPDYAAPEDLLRDADMAMYRAKALGKARHEVFDAGMHTRAVALLQLETDLRWAIERGEFRLWYQPIVSLKTGRITGFEALIRWQHPQRGIVSPAEFIGVAEETGWIVPIGRWVLEESCRQIALWQRQAQSESQAPLSMSVNLSGKQFTQDDLIPFIRQLIEKHALPADCLKLEITESALMDNAQDVTNRLLQLRDLGVRLGLDDFGTGYSSLSYLHRFSLDTLKIDRSFIARMSEGGEHREIVRTIVALGQNLGMDVVAEGVETRAQLEELRELNCQHGQGYFFAQPLAEPKALELLVSAPKW